MKKLLSFLTALAFNHNTSCLFGHKAESKAPEEKIEQKQIKFDESCLKKLDSAFARETTRTWGIDFLNHAQRVLIFNVCNSDEPTEKRVFKISYNPVGWHNYNFYYGDGSKKAWLMNRGHLIVQFSGLND